ncbi:hypothetical protein PTKIN_Ptkin11bG0015300 [Pterospermum kingtungense]
MGIQTMGSQSNGQQSHLQPSPMERQNSWYSLTLNEVESQLGNLGKPLGSMNLDELLNTVWSTESNQSLGMDSESTSSSSSSLQRQASLTLARALSGKTVDQVWKEIQLGQNKRFGEEMMSQEREATFGETTLEDFLVQAGLFVSESSLAPTMELDSTPQSFSQRMDTPMTGRKRDNQDALERSIERRLKRKIKNRESAARSRARKLARFITLLANLYFYSIFFF